MADYYQFVINPAVLGGVSRTIAVAELGSLLGWVSQTCLPRESRE